MTDQIARTPPPIDRRGFLNRTWLAALSVFAVAFGGASIAVLWPERKPGRFGSKIDAGDLRDVLATIDERGQMYVGEGKFYLVRYGTSDPHNRYVQAGVAAAGIMALYQKCSHLGCRVPYCPTSGFFECPCHSAAFNIAGEHIDGPAGGGLWRFGVEVDERGHVIVDTGRPRSQPPTGVDTVGQRPAGAHCVADIVVD